MIPHFKNGNYSKAVSEGVDRIYSSFVNTEETHINTKQMSTGAVISIIALIAGAVIAVFLLIFRIIRYRPRLCLKCGAKMDLLDETADNEYLEQGQRTEEYYNSADYDVWECPSCSHIQEWRYIKFLSRYRGCPKCGYRTMYVTRRTIVMATEYSSGTGEERGCCGNCSYKFTRTYYIPKKINWSDSSGSSASSRFSGSSSGSFGGGSSSGGGASGSW